jgi:hypothetical protein
LCIYIYIPLDVSDYRNNFPLQEKLAQAHKEQESLILVVSQLEDQLVEVRGQLDQEKHNCRYLAQYMYL